MQEEDDFSGLLEELNVSVSGHARASVKAQGAEQLTGRTRRKDKSDRATIETVLDRRTCQALIKLKNGGSFTALSGCIATGKEANVYQALGPAGEDLAVKIYKTSILVFKDRKRYIAGDYRFQKGYSAGNPRKMVAVWAEKEMRNLARLHAACIPCPQPLALRGHVLIMAFLGEHGIPAPRLHDAQLSLEQLQGHYTEAVLLIRRLYQECRLVHADLSEFNILVHRGRLHLLDVSQSVDLDHPYALDFLRADALHVNTFFRRKGVSTLTTRELFEFAVDPSIRPDNMEQAVAALLAVAEGRSCTDQDDTDDAVFAQAFIPRKLEEVEDHEGDFERLEAARGGHCEGIYYQVITGMKADMTGARLHPSICEQEAALRHQDLDAAALERSCSSPGTSSDGSDGEGKSAVVVLPLVGVDESSKVDCPAVQQDPDREGSSGAASSSDSDSDASDAPARAGKSEGPKALSKEERKAHKKSVKEANRERRTHKMPKHVKKKLVNKGKHK